MARVPSLKFKFCPDHQLGLFQVVPGSTPQLHLYIAIEQLVWLLPIGFLTCEVYFIGLFHWPFIKAPERRGESSIQ